MQHINRYVPPDIEGTTSANKLQRRRAPGTLRKDGTQTVRFEMPFAVWCHTCNPHAIIGQGVRFNAEKRKVGNYYSTPIWAFKLKHAACGGSLEIRTDPKNTRYEVTEGGKARDYGEAGEEVRQGEGGVPILTAAERERRREDAFAALEGKVEEKQVVKENAQRIEELYRASEKDWDDPWTRNRRMRDDFRRERKIRKREEEATEKLKERLGTDMEILPETNEDARRAKLVDFRSRSDSVGQPRGALPTQRRDQAANGIRKSKAEALRRQVLGNTRDGLNPFGRNT